MTSNATRGLAIAGIVLALLAGAWLSGKPTREAEARVAELLAQRRDAAQVRAAVSGDATRAVDDGKRFEEGLAADAAAFGIAAVDLASVRRPQAYANELPQALAVAAGKSWRSPHLEIRVGIERVTYQQHGATVAANHVIATVTNISAVPLAYRVVMASAERGRCEIRGSRMHNAMALQPGESAEVVVCAGSGAVRLEKVEVLETTALGQRYLSQIPPQAAGADEVTAAAHRPRDPVEMCSQIDAVALAHQIRAGVIAWADLVDFYSRHNCHRYAFVPGYRRATAELTRLPVLPPPEG